MALNLNSPTLKKDLENALDYMADEVANKISEGYYDSVEEAYSDFEDMVDESDKNIDVVNSILADNSDTDEEMSDEEWDKYVLEHATEVADELANVYSEIGSKYDKIFDSEWEQYEDSIADDGIEEEYWHDRYNEMRNEY